jgi:hypothetical protein
MSESTNVDLIASCGLCCGDCAGHSGEIASWGRKPGLSTVTRLWFGSDTDDCGSSG